MKPFWIKVFSVGKHTDASGRTKQWTEADIDRIIETYNSKDPKVYAPLIKGDHKATYTDEKGNLQIKPAEGYVEELKRDGEFMYANVLPSKQLIEDVRNNNYKFLSIGLGENSTTLDHIAILGSIKPALKNLPQLEFSAPEIKDTAEYEDAYAQFQEVDSKTAKKPAPKADKTDQKNIFNYEETQMNIPEILKPLFDGLIEGVKGQLGDETATIVAEQFQANLSKYVAPQPQPQPPQQPQQQVVPPAPPVAPPVQMSESDKRIQLLERQLFTSRIKDALSSDEFRTRLTPDQISKATIIATRLQESTESGFSDGAGLDQELLEFLKTLPEHRLNSESESQASQYAEASSAVLDAVKEYNNERGQ